MSAGDSPQRCPQCKADVERMSRAMQDIAELTFCLKCHFPLLLIAGKYRLQKMLDRGGFGEIYLAHHINLKRDFERVVKIVKKDILTDSSMRKRFQREIHVTSLLSSENNHIVRIYDDFGEIPKFGYFYVMEYLEGVPLTRLLEDPQHLPPLPLIFHIFRQLCEAMEAAHHAGIVHRDLKPDNIFLVKRKNDPYFVKVLDFGIAKPLDRWGERSVVATQGVLGTPLYMAPEQWDDAAIDHRTDIYAMGILLYEMLTGQTPFWDRTSRRSPSSIMTDHLNTIPRSMQDLRPDRNIPPRLDQLIQQALGKKPTARFASVRTWCQQMEQAYIQAELWPTHGWSEDFNPEKEWGPIRANVPAPRQRQQEQSKVPGFAWPRENTDEWQQERLQSFGKIHSHEAFLETHSAGDPVRDRRGVRQTSPSPLLSEPHASQATQDRIRSAPKRSKNANPKKWNTNDVHFPSQEFPTHRSAPYNLKKLHGAVERQADKDALDDMELQPFHTSRVWLWSSALMMGLIVLASAWFLVQLNKHRPGNSTPLRNEAICGPAHSSWKDHALRVLILPLVSKQALTTESTPKIRRKLYMQQAYQQTFASMTASLGQHRDTFLSIRQSEVGFLEPNPESNRRQARMYGVNCNADLVISGIWLTAAVSAKKLTPASTRTATPQTYLRLFATYTGAPFASDSKDPSSPKVKPRSLDEMLRVGDIDDIKRSKIQPLLRGLMWLQASNFVKESRPLRSFAWKKAAQSLSPLGIKLKPLKPRPKPSKIRSFEVAVPGGEFFLGAGQSAQVERLRIFQIDRYEVSREMYALCVFKGDCTPIPRWLDPPWTYPRDRVSPKQARSYCASLGKKLPTEKQWVKAARGGVRLFGKHNTAPKRAYTWGLSKPTCRHANIKWCHKRSSGKQSIPVPVPYFRKLRDISPYGVYHMIGNVAEIIRDGSIKGGNGFSAARPISWKYHMDQRSGLQWVGFRCVRE